jgi:hypothetical protein
LWQLPAPALNSVSPLNSAGWSVWLSRQMWLMVWPGVSRHSSSTVRPTRMTSPACKATVDAAGDAVGGTGMGQDAGAGG